MKQELEGINLNELRDYMEYGHAHPCTYEMYAAVEYGCIEDQD